jgi:hypothetical protein
MDFVWIKISTFIGEIWTGFTAQRMAKSRLEWAASSGKIMANERIKKFLGDKNGQKPPYQMGFKKSSGLTS